LALPYESPISPYDYVHGVGFNFLGTVRPRFPEFEGKRVMFVGVPSSVLGETPIIPQQTGVGFTDAAFCCSRETFKTCLGAGEIYSTNVESFPGWRVTGHWRGFTRFSREAPEIPIRVSTTTIVAYSRKSDVKYRPKAPSGIYYGDGFIDKLGKLDYEGDIPERNSLRSILKGKQLQDGPVGRMFITSSWIRTSLMIMEQEDVRYEADLVCVHSCQACKSLIEQGQERVRSKLGSVCPHKCPIKSVGECSLCSFYYRRIVLSTLLGVNGTTLYKWADSSGHDGFWL